MGVKCAESLEYRLLNILVLLCQSSSEAEVFGINLVFVDAVQHLVPSHVKPRIIVCFLCSFEALACTMYLLCSEFFTTEETEKIFHCCLGAIFASFVDKLMIQRERVDLNILIVKGFVVSHHCLSVSE